MVVDYDAIRSWMSVTDVCNSGVTTSRIFVIAIRLKGSDKLICCCGPYLVPYFL